MTVGELEDELDRLEDEKKNLERYSMVDDPDDEWGQVNRDIGIVRKLLGQRRSV
ncbi:hypothetical protein SEA_REDWATTLEHOG_4 [Gordonia phage RedWattleHog]|uniref:Uncharacterized protein n=1 Tax=Gordonia phage Stormageddon TaxID=2656541 RepID=A0A649VQU6_9CAUD|nr:hypothetical protein KHQ86_gp004 [Gordonia phage Stormageddon]QGJ94867.1 hypothetical protein SEA_STORMAGEDDON_4 [Gordonia phage Stormageddon]QLF83508.1 hypothetical protein SEA_REDWATTLEHOG_4 [Gordonia phage RedWattleHog]